mgnify:CR=1 FL=1
MTKYKVLGIINLGLGFIEITESFLTILAFATPTQSMETSFKVTLITTWGIPNLYIELGVIILFGLANIFTGLKLLSANIETHEKYFKIGVIFATISLLVLLYMLQMGFLYLGPILWLPP